MTLLIHGFFMDLCVLDSSEDKTIFDTQDDEDLLFKS